MLEHIFPGDSELARLMRGLDWSTTDLGPPESWPENLRTSVSLCLVSRIPIVIYYGPQLTVLYNDSYISVLGEAKHPRYLGRPARECWREIWHTIGPMMEGVLATGQGMWSGDMLLFFARRLPLEEVYVRFTFGPILHRDGRSVDGIFTPCTETTEQVIGARRLETLRRLGVKPLEARTVPAACREAAAVLAENPYDIPFAAIYLADDTGARADLRVVVGLPEGAPALPPSVSLAEDVPSPWPLASVLRGRRAEEINDLGAIAGPFPGGPWPEPSNKALVLPIVTPAHDRLAGLLVVGVGPRLVLDSAYRTFFELIAGHISTSIADARAYEAERRRAEALAELDRAKTAFFSNVSHEFRTPLTLMLGPVEELLTLNDRELSPSAKGQLEIVRRNGLRLQRLVSTLLDFSRIEAGRVRARYQPTDLAAFTADLASVFRAAMERAGLRLVVDCEPLSEPAYVDRDMWEKIVLNLLSNAFKFTFDGEVAVTLRRSEGAAKLCVRDTGTGVPAEEMPRLFERFHRVENARGRTHEGSGIGLALVQELIKLHGGSIAAQSALGEGTTFTVSLPLGSAHLPADQIAEGRGFDPVWTSSSSYVEEALRWLPDEPQEGAPVEVLPHGEPAPLPETMPARGGGDRPLVLIADDNADMRHYIARLLAGRYRVQVFADGEAALAAARELSPSLVLTDVMMPRLDGFGLLREIRNDPRTRETPVIMLSARAGEESRVEGMEAGADDYLVKPFSARELLARVSAHIQIARVRREANEALRESESRFRAIFEQAGAGVCLVEGQSGRFQIVNQALCDIVGYTADELKQLRWQDITHPDDLEADLALALDVLTGVTPGYMMEKRYIHKNGKVVWIHLYGTFIWRPDGTLQYGVGVIMDITSRKQAEEALRRSEEALRYQRAQLHTLLHRAPLGVYLVDDQLRICEVNPVALPVFGDIPGGVIGRDFDEIIHILWHKEYADELVRVFRRTLETGESHVTPERAELRIDRSVVEYYEWRVDRITLPDGRFGVVCYFRDVSAQVQTREALQEADRRKDQFLATLAHELRNPLAPIRNSLHVLRLKGGDAPPRVHDMLDRQVNHMIRLVDDLMEISRITRGKIELRKEPVDLASILQGAVETSKPLIEAARHRLTVDLPSEPLMLDADAVRLTQVFANLLNNAAKFTDEGGQIWVRARRDGDSVEVSVRDNGVGIPAAMLAKVFDLFTQGERPSRRAQGGLGIGLTLVQSLVEMHGGRVEAKSDGPGKGSELIVRLPLMAEQGRSRNEDSTDERLNLMAPRRVLVVDDNVDAAESLGILLRSLGAEAIVVHNGPAALEAIRAQRPALVLLDLGMPEMDGFEVARRARAEPGGEALTIIAVTGWGQPEDRRRSKEAGFDHHLVKPVDFTVLQALLDSIK